MLRETFNQAVKDAMKAGDKRRLSVVRLITAALKDRDIEARGQGKGPVPDEEILGLLQKMTKQTQESLDTAEKAGRADLAEQAREEIAIIAGFLPQQMTEAEMRTAIGVAITEQSAGSVRDMGKVMAALKAEHAGRMDFTQASAMVRSMLTQ